VGYNRYFIKQSFEPETLRLLYAAFDRAWKLVEADIDVGDRNAVRDTIALALIGLAQSGEMDIERLTANAVARARHGLMPPPQAA
jgi:hypothetical protein